MVKHHLGHSHKRLKFPAGFLWGAATSAYQVEGNNANSDWWKWDGEYSKQSTDHYHLFEQDFDLAQKLHHNAHRLSIEWSRIEPVQSGWDWKEVEHYRAVLRALRKRKIKVMLTLHHFTNPQWLVEQGGWENPRTAQLFARYAEFVAEHLGEYVDFWLTFNEPMVYIAQGYILGVWPPEVRSKWRAYKGLRVIAKAHQLAYHEIHAEVNKQHRAARVGIAKNVMSLVSYRKKFIDYVYIRISEYVWNDIFFYLTKNTHDFMGVNYYFHNRVTRDAGGKFIFVDVRKEDRESSDLGWEIYAPGLFEVLLDRQKYGLPIYITENGIAALNDDRRARFIVSHLKELYHAIKAGIDVRGYFHWSLLDNYEWDKGFSPRFGLIDVNYTTLKRTVRPSAHVLAKIARENAITHDLLRYVGHGSKD